MTAGLPDVVSGVGAKVIAARRGAARGSHTGDTALDSGAGADAADRLRRAVFGGIVPLTGPGGPVGALARELCALPFATLVADVDRRGAEVLGASLRGAPAAVVARAAAALEPLLARAVIDAASRDGTAAARDDARRRVAAVGKRASTEALRELGARSLAAALAGEGLSAVTAVAQRLPAALGRVLLHAAREGSAASHGSRDQDDGTCGAGGGGGRARRGGRAGAAARRGGGRSRRAEAIRAQARARGRAGAGGSGRSGGSVARGARAEATRPWPRPAGGDGSPPGWPKGSSAARWRSLPR